jgi:tryptophan-rich sensory protein
MEQITIERVPSKVYWKRKKKLGSAAKKSPRQGKMGQIAFNALIAALFFLIIASACAAMLNFKSLWYDTLIKPPFMPRPHIFVTGSASMFAILGYVFYHALSSGNRAHIVGIAINGVFYVMVVYLFYILKSPLGSFIVISVLVAQTATVMVETWRAKRARALLLLPVILWQCYMLLLVYFILMLN